MANEATGGLYQLTRNWNEVPAQHVSGSQVPATVEYPGKEQETSGGIRVASDAEREDLVAGQSRPGDDEELRCTEWHHSSGISGTKDGSMAEAEWTVELEDKIERTLSQLPHFLGDFIKGHTDFVNELRTQNCPQCQKDFKM